MSETLPLVLVVDDNEMNRDMLSRRLQRQGCEVMVAENGIIALEMVKHHTFELMLLDIMMPQMSGYEVLETLKADEATRALPVIIISAVDDMDSVVKCIEMGAEDYLFKPFNPVLLKARVGATLAKRQSLSPTSLMPQITAIQDALVKLEQSDATASQQAEFIKIQQHLENILNLLKS